MISIEAAGPHGRSDRTCIIKVLLRKSPFKLLLSRSMGVRPAPIEIKDIPMDVIDLPLGQIIPYARNPRRNEKAIATVAASIREFGWRQPVVVDESMVVLAGHTRIEVARQLGLETAPVHVAKGLTEAQARAFRIMDNRSSENVDILRIC